MTSTAWTNSPVGHLGDGEGMKADTMRKKGVIPTTTTSSPFSDAVRITCFEFHLFSDINAFIY